jgi:hypothetical protein
MRLFALYRGVLLTVFVLFMVALFLDYRGVQDRFLEKKNSSLKFSVEEVQVLTPHLTSLSDMSDVNLRPLFVEGRRPIKEQKVNDEVNYEPTDENVNFEVIGIVNDGEKRIAILKDVDTNEQHTLLLGEKLPEKNIEWSVTDVSDKSISIEQEPGLGYSEKGGERSKELLIFNKGQYYSIGSADEWIDKEKSERKIKKGNNESEHIDERHKHIPDNIRSIFFR